MVCKSVKLGLLGGMVGASIVGGLFQSSSAKAATILDFEDGSDGLTNTNYTIGTFGATSGTHADDIVNQGPGVDIANLGTLTAGSSGPSLTDFNSFNAGLSETGPLSLSFDISINTTGITSDGYAQFTLVGNSQNGYFQDGYGNLINGYNIQSSGLSLGTVAASQGATLTPVVPYANGIGTYHFSIPLFTEAAYIAQGGQNDPTYGSGSGLGTSSYYQFDLYDSGGYSSGLTIGLDNVKIGGPVAVPEPASVGVLAVGALTMFRRKSRV